MKGLSVRKFSKIIKELDKEPIIERDTSKGYFEKKLGDFLVYFDWITDEEKNKVYIDNILILEDDDELFINDFQWMTIHELVSLLFTFEDYEPESMHAFGLGD
tara:strand:+ start:8456 stop:8764 length:309 start_codon:yes stop_codon:yes gene_type:complete